MLVNKTDRLTDIPRHDTLRRVTGRVREQNPDAQVLPVTRGRVDPALVYDTTAAEHPPAQAYRIEGRIGVATARGRRGDVVHLVGRTVHLHPAPATTDTTSSLVAIGIGLDTEEADRRLREALEPTPRASDRGYRDLRRSCALSR